METEARSGNPVQEYPVKLVVVLAILLAMVDPVSADSGQELANAKNAFEIVKSAMSSGVNSLPREQRTAIWTQYYLALEHLQRMDIHYKMMERHDENRGELFRESHAKFIVALDELVRLLPDLDRLLPEQQGLDSN